jgi:trimethylamine:corrinoid methyltransferase-like protein
MPRMTTSFRIQPTINVLSPEVIAQVHGFSLKIFSEIGVRIDSINALKVLKISQGVNFLDEQHVVFHKEIVEWAIQ